MIKSIRSDFLITLGVWAIGLFVAIGPFPVLASDSSSTDETAIHIVLTSESIRVDTVELCSLAELKSVLNTRLRSTPVAVEATAESKTEIAFKIREILSGLGFDQVTFEGVGSPGWGLYPPSPDAEFHGCDKRQSEDSVEIE